MKASDAVDVLAYVRGNWHVSAPADPKDDIELAIWIKELADVEVQDADTAIHRFGMSNFPPTALQVANVAKAERHFRAGRLELPGPGGTTLEEWLDSASAEERETFARVSPTLREKFGVDLADIEELA